MLILGDRLDKPTYKVIETINEGNTAICYRAYHDIFKEEVVQKTISLLGVGDAIAAREPYLLNRFRHEHVAEIREAQWSEAMKAINAITFIMPYYDGGSVKARLELGHRFSVGQAISITCQLLDALHYLHVDERVVHRDVKPGNIFLDGNHERAFLGDLGSAAEIGETGYVEARGGTLLYRPPEAHTGFYGPQGDVYSAGMVLLELLNGAFPYASIRYDDVDSRLRQGKPPLSKRLLAPDVHVPGPLSRIIRSMIDPEPMRRLQSASVAQRELQRVRHMDWLPTSEGGLRKWSGHVSSTQGLTRRRIFEVFSREIKSGNDKGKIELVAQWREGSGQNWRRMKGLTQRVDVGDDVSARAFFKSVSTKALQ